MIAMRDKIEFLIEVLNNIVNAKKAERYKLVGIFKHSESIVILQDKILNDWDSVRLKLAKCMYSNQYEKESFESIIKNIKNCFNLEQEYFYLLFRVMDSIVRVVSNGNCSITE